MQRLSLPFVGRASPPPHGFPLLPACPTGTTRNKGLRPAVKENGEWREQVLPTLVNTSFYIFLGLLALPTVVVGGAPPHPPERHEPPSGRWRSYEDIRGKSRKIGSKP